MIATSPKFRTPDCPFSSIQCKDLLQVTHWCGTRNGRTWAPQWPVWCSSRSASWTWNLGFGCKLGWKSETCSTCIEVCTFWPSYNTVPHYLLCFYCISVGCFFFQPQAEVHAIAGESPFLFIASWHKGQFMMTQNDFHPSTVCYAATANGHGVYTL